MDSHRTLNRSHIEKQARDLYQQVNGGVSKEQLEHLIQQSVELKIRQLEASGVTVIE